MANLGSWYIENTIYENLETLTGETFTSSGKYLIQVEGSFWMCRKDSAPDEKEGFHYRETEKTFEYTHGSPNFYIKKDDFSLGPVRINIDEEEE